MTSGLKGYYLGMSVKRLFFMKSDFKDIYTMYTYIYKINVLLYGIKVIIYSSGSYIYDILDLRNTINLGAVKKNILISHLEEHIQNTRVHAIKCHLLY